MESGDTRFWDCLNTVKPKHLISTKGLNDVLYEPGNLHAVVVREPRDLEIGDHDVGSGVAAHPTHHLTPHVHYGLIASGSWVIKTSGSRRSDLIKNTRRDDILCFEMEACGLMNTFPCLVVRGISDYCDSHKNDGWHEVAATSAACYCKCLLEAMPTN